MAPARNAPRKVSSDILDQIANLVPAPKSPKSSKPSKWELPLTPEAKEYALRWICAKTLHGPVKERMDQSKDQFCEYALRILAENLFKNKTKPSNPLVVIKKDGKADHQFQFQMTDKFKYRFPDVPDGIDPRDHFIKIFESVGLHPTEAEKLVDNELDFNPITSLKSLTELMDGTYGAGREWIESTEESKQAGKKLAALIMWQEGQPAPEPLSIQEKSMILDRSPGMVVKAGFYSRVAGYCTTVDQLMGIFSIIQPIAYPVYEKFAIEDSQMEKMNRMVDAAADILGSSVVVEKV